MTRIAAQVAMAQNSNLPRDYVVNTLAFNHSLELVVGAPDWQALADDLRGIYDALIANQTHIKVSLYDLADGKPRPVRGFSEIGKGTAFQITSPGEVALCLSFYAGRNLPRQRGRVYLPPQLMGLGSTSARPSALAMTTALGLADNLSGLGGANVDWCVHSRADDAFRKVTHAYCDDEWDTQRRRGARATTRQEKDVSG